MNTVPLQHASGDNIYGIRQVITLDQFVVCFHIPIFIYILCFIQISP